MTKTNYDIFIDTVESLKYSQGFYSRLSQQVHELDEDSKSELREQLNALPPWSGTLDCVLYLEQ